MTEDHLVQLPRLIEEHSVRSVLEIGSFLGISTAFFAERVERVTCVDTWREDATVDSANNMRWTLRYYGIPQDFYLVFEERMKAKGIWDKISCVRGNSRDRGIAELVGLADLVYIDGDHSYEGCKSDIGLWGPKAAKVLCGDDFVVREDYGVIEAVTETVPGFQRAGQVWWKVVG
jgi:hypothetical protein